MPKLLVEINPVIRTQILRSLLAEWKKYFEKFKRERTLQCSISVPYPINTGYNFKLIVDLQKEGLTIIHSFKEEISIEALKDQVF